MAVASDIPLPRSSFSHSDNFMPSLLARCHAKSIAPYEFYYLARGYQIARMKPVGEIRRENLLLLLQQHGSLANLNDRLGLSRTDATLSQIKNRSITSRGKPKMMGVIMARRIELGLALPEGWMDKDQQPPSYRQQRIDHVTKAMEHMEDWQVDQAVKIVDTIAQPVPKRGNGE